MRKAVVSFLGFAVWGACTALGDPFTFYGEDEGGVGAATMAFSSTGPTTTLLVSLANTSPTTLLSGTGLNTPGITGFGFNALEPIPTVTSWALWAYAADKTTAVQIGGPGSTGDWTLNTTIAGVTLDFLPKTKKANIKGALYNPAATDGFGAAPQYFTSATLTLTFSTPFSLSLELADPNGQGSPFVRFQNVGEGGAGSLKLGAVPEPASLALVFLGLASLGAGAMVRRRRQARVTQ